MTEIVFAHNTSQEMKDEVLRIASIWKPKNKTRLVCEHGVNDSDYMTGTSTLYSQWSCPIYQKWLNMLQRAYSPSESIKRPTYLDVEVHPDWFSFMIFRKWCLENRWRSDYHLDKDFISNQKIYGPDTCAFIPSVINTFIVDCSSTRGDYPIGVSKLNNKYQSQCNNPFTKKRDYLGVYKNPEDAYMAWKHKKHEHALALADMYPDLDPRVLNALRTKYLN